MIPNDHKQIGLGIAAASRQPREWNEARPLPGKPSRKPPPLIDDPWPLAEAVKLCIQQAGRMDLGVTDIEKAMAEGSPRCMRRDIVTGDRELVSPEFWIDHLIDASLIYSGVVAIYRRRDEPRGWGVLANRNEDRVDGHAYYVSRSDVERLWPTQDQVRITPTRRARSSGGPRLLSDEQIERGKAEYNRLLDSNPQRWRPQQAAAKHIAVECLKLLEQSWQTVEDQIVVPVLIERGLKPRDSKTMRQKK